ncbi:MAG TPA: M20/M25/M40 family metallo-hydrolase [Candidatus Binatia bacterium]|nr:M20/M25/M40 family metallo-hydrolase [Candidatus Binatia bacterium]
MQRAPILVTALSLLANSASAANPAITADALRAHIRFLSSDLLEGRGTASRGDDVAMSYIAAQMEGMGLQPGAPDGGWLQRFDVVGITSHGPDTVEFRHGSERVVLKGREEFIGVSGVQKESSGLKDAELVFVGYGIQAPEYQWDDFKDADLKGKVLVMMNNDPESDPQLFAGKRRLYYGRWDYKYAQGGRAGAAGVILIHTEHSAAYPWQVVQTSWTGENFELPDEGEPRLQVKAWATEDACRRLAKLGGQDLDALRARAEQRDFRPVPLGVTVSLDLKNDLHRTQTANVIGRLPGAGKALAREAVFYTAHHDHLGLKPGVAGADAIYNGALDNASGVATLLVLAQSFAQQAQKPRRTLYFAAVGAEEQGLLGSKYLAAHPPVHAGRIAADINMDGINIWGPTSDVTVIGLGKSSLDDTLRTLTAAQKRGVVDDPFPDKGSYYRSDQFSFARIGVPSAYVRSGTEVIGKPKGWGREQQEAFVAKDYHQPSDELRDSWNLDGAVQDAMLLLRLGQRVADAPAMPRWRAGDEFEATRKKALAEAAALK